MSKHNPGSPACRHAGPGPGIATHMARTMRQNRPLFFMTYLASDILLQPQKKEPTKQDSKKSVNWFFVISVSNYLCKSVCQPLEPASGRLLEGRLQQNLIPNLPWGLIVIRRTLWMKSAFKRLSFPQSREKERWKSPKDNKMRHLITFNPQRHRKQEHLAGEENKGQEEADNRACLLIQPSWKRKGCVRTDRCPDTALRAQAEIQNWGLTKSGSKFMVWGIEETRYPANRQRSSELSMSKDQL